MYRVELDALTTSFMKNKTIMAGGPSWRPPDQTRPVSFLLQTGFEHIFFTSCSVCWKVGCAVVPSSDEICILDTCPLDPNNDIDSDLVCHGKDN